jgi:flagellar biosynthesis/type III secretory pathway M-ring protein FliF/YscJ
VPEGVVSGIVFALTPTIVVGLIFWFVMRAIMRADRTERAAYAKVEAEERARFEREHGRPAPAPTSAK